MKIKGKQLTITFNVYNTKEKVGGVERKTQLVSSPQTDSRRFC